MSVEAESEIERTVGERELIVVTRAGGTKGAVAGFLGPLSGTWWPLFPPLRGERQFYRVEADDESLEEIAGTLRRQEEVEAVYIKPAAGVPKLTVPPSQSAWPTLAQPYLGAAPEGVGAVEAWNTPGGDGAGVRIADLEWHWILDHEDLPLNTTSMLFGSGGGDADHGSAVVGIMAGLRNEYGITGIAHGATIRLASFAGAKSTASVIARAASHLDRGDVMLIVFERPGPVGWIPLEWWDDDQQAIRHAIDRGVIVVQAAGNGGVNLDDPAHERGLDHFTSGWRNPFRDADRGSILVGAGAPPPGTNGLDWGPDRSRTRESNYGSAVDAQGWGREVSTAGGGDVQRGYDRRQWYTERFRMTSAAAPMVAAVIACVQGARKRAGKKPLDGFAVREALRRPGMGSPQQDGKKERAADRPIGQRPDLARLLRLP